MKRSNFSVSAPVPLSPDVLSRTPSRSGCFLRDVVHQVVDVEHVAAGEDAGDVGLQALVHYGAGGDGAQLHMGGAAC